MLRMVLSERPKAEGLGIDISAGALMIAAHVVMLPLMLAAMIWRRADYWH